MLSATQALALLAPVPLIIAILLYGYRSVLGACAVALVSAFVLMQVIAQMGAMMATFVFVAAVSFRVAHSFISNDHPVIGVFRSGISIFAGLLLIVFVVSLLRSGGVTAQVEEIVQGAIETFMSSPENQKFIERGEGNAAIMREYVENPDKIVSLIVNWAFGFIFVGVFLSVWLSYFLTLRNELVWNKERAYQYQLSELTNFRLPDFMVWPLIVALVFFLGSGHFLPQFFATLGGNVLMCLGVMYFFQGFGLYHDFLTHFNVVGFFRSLLLVMAILFAWEVIAFVGLFDTWFNFRKYLNKKINEN